MTLSSSLVSKQTLLLDLLLRNVVVFVILLLLTIATTTTNNNNVFVNGQSLGFGNEKSPYPEPTYENVVKVASVGARHNFALPESGQTIYPLIPNYRQNVCDRYHSVRVGNITLRDALQGMELRPLMRVGSFFHYTRERGIDPNDPGLLAIMMDELGRRAGFTWRNSFGVVFGLPEKPQPQTAGTSSSTAAEQVDNTPSNNANTDGNNLVAVEFEDQDINSTTSLASNSTITATISVPTTSSPTSAPQFGGEDITFTDLLVWSVDTYDISINWWDSTLERLERGTSFLKPWFDGSIILIQKGARNPEVIDEDTIRWWNWSRPFEPAVWLLTILTVITSGMTYQIIEHFNNDRDNRSWWQWFSDGVYLSAINFPQNYEFQPKSAAGRIFGVSIGFWALVMTATCK